jgi:hypothetical protein
MSPAASSCPSHRLSLFGVTQPDTYAQECYAACSPLGYSAGCTSRSYVLKQH